MKDWRLWLLLLGFWLVPVMAGQAQTFREGAIEEKKTEAPPTSGIRDNAGVFHRNPALLAKLTEQIQQLREEHDFQIYLILESVLVSGDVQSLASKYQQDWLPDGNGMVLVFEMDSKSLGFGNKYDSNPDGGKVSGQVPSFQRTAILTQATTDLPKTTSADVFLDTLVTRLTTGYNSYFQRASMPAPEGRSLKIGLLMVGGASALGLIGLITLLLLKRLDQGMSRKCFFFPETEAVERLGAPYGGGEVSSRRFGTGGSGLS